MAESQSVETTKEAFGKGEAAKARRWINELDLASRNQNAWLERCRQIIRKYKNERATSDALMANDRRRMAVLWSNIEVLKPAVYAKPPQAVVLRRFQDQDQIGRVSAEVLERALNYSVDVYNYDWLLKQCRDDNLLCGLGQMWARYHPTIEQEEIQGEEEGEQVSNDAQYNSSEGNEESPQYREYLKSEKICWDHVHYADFLTNKARTWEEVRYVARRVYMTRDALKERFITKVPGTGQTLGEVIPLDWQPEKNRQTEDGGQNMEMFQKAQIYEIWDLDSRKVYWISKSYPERVLDEIEDPLQLRDFFPCPRPVFSTLGPDSIIPVPDYLFYQDQAEEIDDLTKRIGILTDSLRLVGFYAGEAEVDLQNVFRTGNENKLIPIDSWAQFKESGGVRGQIEWVPIDMVVACLTACYESRKQLLDDVYQITGISDIMRGDTDARETKGAQVLKSQFGSQRVRERQKELARFARDGLRIAAEIMAEHFSWKTLKEITNIQLLSQEEKSMIQLAMQMQQQAQPPQPQMGMDSMQPSGPSTPPAPAGAPPSLPPGIKPEQLELMDKPTWEEVEQFLKNDMLRLCRIDVETDSTIEPNLAEAKQDMVEFISAVGGLLQQSLPVIMAAPPMGELVGEMVKHGARLFSFGREMEDTIERVMDQIGQMQGPANQPQEQGKAGPDPQIEAMKAQIQQMEIQQRAQAAEQAEMTKRMGIVSKEKIEAAKIENDKEQRALEQANAFLDSVSQRVHDSEMAQRQGMMDSDEAERDRQFQYDQGERDREHGSNEAAQDRENQLALLRAKPKPG